MCVLPCSVVSNSLWPMDCSTNLALYIEWTWNNGPVPIYIYPSIAVLSILHSCKVLRLSVQFSSVQLLSYVLLFAIPWTGARQASLSITNSRILLKLMSIESVMPSNHLILCCLLLLLPSIFPSIRVFSNQSVLHIRWPKYWSFPASASVLPMNTQDWFPLRWTGWLSLLSKGLSRAFSITTIQKHQFFHSQPSLWRSSHISTWLLEKPWLWLDRPREPNDLYEKEKQ